MAERVFIVGESGSGKSSGIYNPDIPNQIGLDPKETFLIFVEKASLPGKGWKKVFTEMKYSFSKTASGVTLNISQEGNYVFNDQATQIYHILQHIDKNMPHIKNVILDDYRYIMSNLYFKKSADKGYDKFVTIAKSAWTTVNAMKDMRQDLICFILTHDEPLMSGGFVTGRKVMTLGKMIDSSYNLEGTSNIILFTPSGADVGDGVPDYCFLTQKNAGKISCTAKSPYGMFDKPCIPNDLGYVRKKIIEYNEG